VNNVTYKQYDDKTLLLVVMLLIIGHVTAGRRIRETSRHCDKQMATIYIQ